jgi:hypothetical protein
MDSWHFCPPSPSLLGELYRIRNSPASILSSCLVTIKRYDEFPKRSVEGLKQSRSKTNAARANTTVGVFNILPTNCMRKAFYREKLDTDLPAEPTMPYVRGRAVEAAISWLLFGNAGAPMQRHKRHEKDGIVCYTDISDSDTIVEIKDTSAGRRLTPDDIQFKGYLMQVLYYMVIAEKEEALILINYSSRELIWHHNDSDGRSWFYRPANAKCAGIECWQVRMPKDDYARELLWEQMVRRKVAFFDAMRANDVSLLPRVRMRDRRLKCSRCPFYQKCMQRDGETEEAHAMANDLDLLEVTGFLSSSVS